MTRALQSTLSQNPGGDPLSVTDGVRTEILVSNIGFRANFFCQAPPHTLSAPTTRGGSGVQPPCMQTGLTTTMATVTWQSVDQMVS